MTSTRIGEDAAVALSLRAAFHQSDAIERQIAWAERARSPLASDASKADQAIPGFVMGVLIALPLWMLVGLLAF
jgi:hypothetical protein